MGKNVRRSGGRASRVALRQAPLEKSLRPIQPGLEGGLYRPLSARDIERIHEAACTLLERTGLGLPTESCVRLMTGVGCTLGEDGRIRIPRALVEDTIAGAGRHFVLHAQDPEWDMEPWGDKVYFGTAGAAVHVVDPIERSYRNSTHRDLYQAARLVDQLDNLHYFQRSMVCRDIEDNAEMDLNTCFATAAGTRKHSASSWTHVDTMPESLALLHAIAGGEEAWRRRPFMSQSNCFVVPPMKFAQDACACLEYAVRAGFPILLLAAGQAGATSPAALAGAVVQEIAEILGGLVYVNAIQPGHPCIMGGWPFVSDLRTGAMSGGSAEQALLMAASAQVTKSYDLTTGNAAGMTDSKLPDFQAGAENALNYALVAHSGCNMVYEAGGMHASLLGFCPESLVLAHDAIGATMRTLRGIEVNEDTLSVEVIHQVCTEGPGHFLGADQTIERMQRDYVYPEVGNRMSPKEWQEADKPDLLLEARARMEALLLNPPGHIDEGLKERLYQCFPTLIRV